MCKLMYNVSALRMAHNFPSHNRPPCNPYNQYIMYKNVLEKGEKLFFVFTRGEIKIIVKGTLKPFHLLLLIHKVTLLQSKA